MYGIKVKINSIKGKIAIKKLNAIPPALVVKAPSIIPVMYISRTSYKDIPSKPGILIFFPNFTKIFTSGIFSSLSSISLLNDVFHVYLIIASLIYDMTKRSTYAFLFYNKFFCQITTPYFASNTYNIHAG